MRTILAAGTATLALLFFGAACGGDDDNGDKATPAGAASASTSAPGGAQATQKPQQSPTTSSQAAKLSDLLKESATKSYYLSYSFEITGSNPIKGAMIVAQKPPKSLNSFQIENQGTFSTINDGQATYTCTKLGAQPSGLCQKGGGANIGASFFNLTTFAQVASQVSDAKEIDSRKIAGRDARCFEYTTSGSPSTICVDKSDGLMLYVQADQGGGKMTIAATEVKTSFDDGVFELPYKLQ